VSETNRDTVERLFTVFADGLRRGDFGAVFDTGLLAPDAEWVPVAGAGLGASYRGPEGFVEFMETWTGVIGDLEVELERAVDAGDAGVVVVGHQSGRGEGSGVPVEWRFGQIFEFDDGRVARIRNFTEPAEAFRAAGMDEAH
jgi:ketosteroid isomerase-like protein